MKIHLVEGFTGSGKTAAINSACRILNNRNIKCSIIKATGYDYASLDLQIETLKNVAAPSVVFAEYGITCTGLEESMLKTLRESYGAALEASNISTFADAQLLLPYLRGVDISLNADEKSVWERQIREADILVVSKIDLLSDCQFEAMKVFANDYFPSKKVLLLDSWDSTLVSNWLEVIENEGNKKDDGDDKKETEDSVGPTRLEEEIEIVTIDHSAVGIAYDLMTALSLDIVQRDLHTEHFQFFLSFDGRSSTINHTALTVDHGLSAKTSEKSNTVDLLINGCVHTSPGELRKILIGRLNQLKCIEGLTIKEKFVSYYPGKK